MNQFEVKNNSLYQTFLDQKTIFGLKANKNVEDYFNWLQESFPSLDKQKLNNELQKFANFDESTKIVLGMKSVLLDKETVEKVKKEIYSQLDQLIFDKNLLFSPKPEIVESLKEKIDHSLAFQRVDNLTF
jgi:hypothetical protein